MTEFSANLGFLWTERPLPDAIRAAKAAGFDAVECHWPYATPPADVLAALHETGLPMLGLNTSRGDVSAGDNGLSALPDRVSEARTAIDEAIAYAQATGTQSVHVMAGFASGSEAQATFVSNLVYASERAKELTFLIEPLNRYDAPGYFLQTTDQAREILTQVACPNVKLMFDCYHVGRTEGDVITRLKQHRAIIGHIQFAGVPARGRPDQGDVNFAAVFEAIADLDWPLPLGAEYKPNGDTDATLGWMAIFKA
jgi:hydroxypyruvate isomerase